MREKEEKTELEFPCEGSRSGMEYSEVAELFVRSLVRLSYVRDEAREGGCAKRNLCRAGSAAGIARSHQYPPSLAAWRVLSICYPPTRSFQIARHNFAAANTRAVEILAHHTLPHNTQSIVRKIRITSTLYFSTGKPVDHRAFDSLGTEPIYPSL